MSHADSLIRDQSEHKKAHKTDGNPLRSIFPPKVVSEPDPASGHYNPYPTFPYTGKLRPVYPLSPKRPVPGSIKLPDYALDGVPKEGQKLLGRNNITILDKKGQDGMRKVCRLAREVLDIVAAEIKPGSYPSPLNYVRFPKSICTSLNEIICHGIPDQRKLEDGDIVNLDVTLYHGGFHGDLNETYYVGPAALSNPDTVRVVEAARTCLAKAIEIVKPGMPFREPGNVIEKHAKTQNTSVIKTYCGHGVNQVFHAAPNIPHYAKNKAVGVAKAGMAFTIEPMIALGSHRDKTWPDDWTSATVDGRWTAQFEHTLLVTEEGVEVLTARKEDSPGGPVEMPEMKRNGVDGEKKTENGTA
ncbi:Methionine aminopeptidase 1 [Thelotrema lepadinum]|nr:Methionine aminopeptidase 1 [Thelotrema lepadinum]